MPSDNIQNIQIPLDQAEVALIAAVLQGAAHECRAIAGDPTPTGQDAGVTLGALAVHWTEIAEREHHCSIVNMHGERLFAVPLTAEAWYQVRAALSARAAELSRGADDRSAVGQVDRKRAMRALLLADKIAETASA